MNFSDLMNIASSKQQVTDVKVKSKKSKGGNSSQVSSQAVKAFLAKQSAEKTKQKEQEEAAKRARIQARLEQEKKDKLSKNKKTPDTTKDFESRKQTVSEKHHPKLAMPPLKNQTTGETKRTAHERKYVADTKEKDVRKKKYEEKRADGRKFEEKRAGGKKYEGKRADGKKYEGKRADGKKYEGKRADGKKYEGKRADGKKYEGKRADGKKYEGKRADGKKFGEKRADGKKIGEKHADGKKFGEKRANDSGDKNDIEKPASKVKKPAAPTLSFQELMNVAKQQANNPDAVRNLATPNHKLKEDKTRVEEKPLSEDRHIRVENSRRKASVKSSSATSKVLKETPEKRTSASVSRKNDKGPPGVQQRKLPRKTEPEVKRGPSEKPQKMIIERETISQKLDGHSPVKHRGVLPNGISPDQRKRRRNDDYPLEDDDYEDDMDEFIDDSDTAPDISSYIKEIFGYDRNKFHDRDDNVDNMESSFADIQKEEAKSSRIAKLEDEIERLKETYELDRQQKKKLKH